MKCNDVIDVSRIVPKHGETIYLGVFSTFHAREQRFDLTAWQKKYGVDAAFAVNLKRPGDSVPYAVAGVSVDGAIATWTFDATDTERSGVGSVFLSYRGEDFFEQTVDIPVQIEKNSGPAGEEPPDPLENWYDRMLEASADAEAAAERAEEAAVRQPYPNPETGTWWIWNGEQYADTGIGYGAGTYVHTQGEAADTWTIRHDLAKYPSVTVVDSTGRVVVGGVQYADQMTMILTFSGAFSGVAYLN